MVTLSSPGLPHADIEETMLHFSFVPAFLDREKRDTERGTRALSACTAWGAAECGYKKTRMLNIWYRQAFITGPNKHYLLLELWDAESEREIRHIFIYFFWAGVEDPPFISAPLKKAVFGL